MKSLIIAVLVSSSLIVVSDAADAGNLASGKKLEVKIDPKKADEETAALWQRFGGWCAIAEWQPAVKKCEETKEGNDVFRTLTLGDGGKIKEKLLNKTPTSYRYAIIKSPLPVKNYEAQFSIVADDDHADEVNIVWAATYDAADFWKPVQHCRGHWLAAVSSLSGDGLLLERHARRLAGAANLRSGFQYPHSRSRAGPSLYDFCKQTSLHCAFRFATVKTVAPVIESKLCRWLSKCFSTAP
jgi:hypothetical protein